MYIMWVCLFSALSHRVGALQIPIIIIIIKTAAWNRKHGRSTVLGKEVFFWLPLNESKEGFSQRGRQR